MYPLPLHRGLCESEQLLYGLSANGRLFGESLLALGFCSVHCLLFLSLFLQLDVSVVVAPPLPPLPSPEAFPEGNPFTCKPNAVAICGV
jgi:hypothetical protein